MNKVIIYSIKAIIKSVLWALEKLLLKTAANSKKQVTVDTVSTYSDFEFSIMETSKEYKRDRQLAPMTIINKKMKFKKET